MCIRDSHNAAASNLVIGERCARAALALCYGRDIDWMAPEPETAVQTAPDTVKLCFSRIRNWLNAYEVPAALLPFDAEDAEGLVQKVKKSFIYSRFCMRFWRTQRNSQRKECVT